MHLRRPRTAAGANRTKRAEATADGQRGRAAGPPDILASRQAANSTAATLQRQKKGASQAANIAKITALRTKVESRFDLVNTYAQDSLAVGDLTRDKLSAISTVYTEAYNTFRGVLNRAQQEAQNQQRWTDVVVGVICGTAAGLAAAFVLPSTAAGWFSLTLAEAGTAAASSAGQGIASGAIAAAASSLTTVAGQNINSSGLDPMIQQVAMWQRVAGIYRSGLELTPLSRATHALSLALADLLAEVRVLEAGGKTKLTEATIASTLATLEQQESGLTPVTTELTAKVTDLAALKASVQAIDPKAKPVTAVERDIWVMWMSTLAHDSNILDIDAIEDHIGPKGLKIVDFGIYTFDSDENAAIDQAKTDAMFLDAEAKGTDVPKGQVVGGPHTAPR